MSKNKSGVDADKEHQGNSKEGFNESNSVKQDTGDNEGTISREKPAKPKGIDKFKHDLTVAIVPVILASIFGVVAYFYKGIADVCSGPASIDLGLVEQVENTMYRTGLEIGESDLYKENVQLFEDYFNSEDLNEQKKIKNKLMMLYYKDANKDIFEKVKESNDELLKNEVSRVSYLFGNAGVGKSFVKEHIAAEYGEHSCIVKLHDLIQVGQKYGTNIEMRDQLFDEAYSLGSLPYIKEPGSFRFNSLLKDAECELDSTPEIVIIDDLDELHPDTAALILKSIDKMVQPSKRQKGIFHFIVFGRPEAFSQWLSNSHYERPEEFFNASITGPQYLKDSDLKLMIMNFFNYKMARKSSESERKDIISSIQANPYLFHTQLGNLSNGNFVAKEILDEESKGSIIRDNLFQNFLGRNSGSHNRPQPTGAKGVVYKNLLQNIAAAYAGNVDSEGYFRVGVSDSIAVAKNVNEKNVDLLVKQGSCDVEHYNFNVQQALEYSGVVSIIPIDEKVKKYSFSPFWLHKYLVEKRKTRLEAE